MPDTTADLGQGKTQSNETMIEPNSFEGPGQAQDSLAQRHLLQIENRVRLEHLMDELRETPTEDQIMRTYQESTMPKADPKSYQSEVGMKVTPQVIREQ